MDYQKLPKRHNEKRLERKSQTEHKTWYRFICVMTYLLYTIKMYNGIMDNSKKLENSSFLRVRRNSKAIELCQTRKNYN